MADRDGGKSTTEVFIQGLVTGIVVARLNTKLILGALVGAAVGAMYQQQVRVAVNFS